MTPDELVTVQRTWAGLERRRSGLHEALTRRFATASPTATPPSDRADWLLDAADALVGLLAAPSRLATQARALGATWPDPCTAPSFAVEGQAWLDAAGECLPTWSSEAADAWRQAWLLLSDVLAIEALSPFGDRPVAEPLPSPDPTKGPS